MPTPSPTRTLSRRDALLTTAALTAGTTAAASAMAANAGTVANASGAAEDAYATQHVAHECLMLASATQQCLTSCLGRNDTSTKAFARLCQDVQQICTVTATRLSQHQGGSPAICQASGDAALRLARACETIDLRGLEKFCQTQAHRCATACHQSVVRQTA